MNIENLADGAEEFTSNAFLVDEDTLVDTGADEIVLDKLEDTVIDRVVITHTHWDHIENLETIVEWFDPVVYVGPSNRDGPRTDTSNEESVTFEPDNLPDGIDAEQITDGDTIRLGKTDTPFIVVHTPGHKDDSICLYAPEENILFSGDLIFPGGAFGRTDLDEGDRDTLIKSIERIDGLDVQEMYPGHDDPVTENVNEQIQESLEEAKKHEPKYADE